MRKLFKLTPLLALSVLLLSACNMPVGNAEPTASGDQVRTAAAQTVQALQTQLAATMPAGPTATTETQPTESVLPTASIATDTPVPAATNTRAPVVNPPTAKPSICDKAGFVADVNVPDGTKFDAGETFTKTWRLKNDGTCTWTTGYKLVFVSGDAMGGPATVDLPNSVDPGQTIDLSVKLKAPNAAKTYQGNWQLQNASGKKFGVGGNADQAFWVKIVVGNGTAVPDYFAVTGVTTTAKQSGDECTNLTVTFTAKITTSKAGTVNYEWRRYDDTTSQKKSIVFDEGGTKTVTDALTGLDASAGDLEDIWDQLYVDNPNHQLFPKATITVSCP